MDPNGPNPRFHVVPVVVPDVVPAVLVLLSGHGARHRAGAALRSDCANESEFPNFRAKKC